MTSSEKDQERIAELERKVLKLEKQLRRRYVETSAVDALGYKIREQCWTIANHLSDGDDYVLTAPAITGSCKQCPNMLFCQIGVMGRDKYRE